MLEFNALSPELWPLAVLLLHDCVQLDPGASSDERTWLNDRILERMRAQRDQPAGAALREACGEVLNDALAEAKRRQDAPAMAEFRKALDDPKLRREIHRLCTARLDARTSADDRAAMLDALRAALTGHAFEGELSGLCAGLLPKERAVARVKAARPRKHRVLVSLDLWSVFLVYVRELFAADGAFTAAESAVVLRLFEDRLLAARETMNHEEMADWQARWLARAVESMLAAVLAQHPRVAAAKRQSWGGLESFAAWTSALGGAIRARDPQREELQTILAAFLSLHLALDPRLFDEARFAALHAALTLVGRALEVTAAEAQAACAAACEREVGILSLGGEVDPSVRLSMFAICGRLAYQGDRKIVDEESKALVDLMQRLAISKGTAQKLSEYTNVPLAALCARIPAKFHAAVAWEALQVAYADRDLAAEELAELRRIQESLQLDPRTWAALRLRLSVEKGRFLSW